MELQVREPSSGRPRYPIMPFFSVPLSVLGLLFLVEGSFKATPEGMAAAGFPLAAPHHLGLALADLTHQCSKHLIDVITERSGGLKKRALELPRQLFALLYRHLNR